MENLKLTLRKKLEETSHLQSVFESMPENVDPMQLWQARQETLIMNVLQQKMEETSKLFSIQRKLTRMNDVENEMHRLVYRQARFDQLFLRREADYYDLLPTGADNRIMDMMLVLKIVGDHLLQNSTMCCSQNLCDYFISFEGYLKAIEQLRWIPFIPLWFTPKLFMRLAEKEMGGGVSISMFFEYAHKKLDNYRLRLDLFRIDENGKGYVTKENLWSYFCQTLNLDEWCCESNDGRKNQISSLYIQYLVSEMFFILDQHRTKKIKIVELLDSQLLQNITQKFSESVVFGRFMKKMAAFNAMSLDDVDGCIPVVSFCEKFPDFSQNIWGGSNNEKRFLDSFIHQLVKIYGDSTKEKGKINFDTFLNITFACENLDTSHNISSICYFFRVLDLDSKGYLDEMDLQFHYRNIQEYLEKKMSLSFKGLEQQRLANFKNIQSQFSDMLAGEGGLSHITPAKLWNTRSGFMLIEFLVDATQSLEKQDEEYPQMNTDSSFAANDLMTDGTHGHSSLTTCKKNLESVNSVIDLSTHPHPPSHSSNTFKTEEGQGDVPKDSGVAGVVL